MISGSLQDSECCVNGFLLISNFFSLDEIETCNQGVFSQQFVGYDTFHATIIFFCSVKQNNKTTKAMISVVGGPVKYSSLHRVWAFIIFSSGKKKMHDLPPTTYNVISRNHSN